MVQKFNPIEERRKYNRDYYNNSTKEQKQRILERQRISRKRITDFINNYKLANSCECGETHTACLEFHHTDPSTKDFDVALAVNKCLSLEKLIQEISKCIVLCANCHRKLHFMMKN